jgi:hypothetical protein
MPSHYTNSLCVKLSHGLVLTGWGAHPNCNLVLNYAGLPRRLLRQKLQDEKCISFSKSTKRSLCNIHRNRWCITRGTQLKRRVLPLESRSYNQSHHSTKAYCFSKMNDQKHILVCIKFCLTFLNSTRLSFASNQVYSLVHIYHHVILHCFLCSPSCCNLETRFLLREEGCNTSCYGDPN